MPPTPALGSIDLFDPGPVLNRPPRLRRREALFWVCAWVTGRVGVPVGGTGSAPAMDACRRFDPVVGVAVGVGAIELSELMMVMGKGVVRDGSVMRPSP